MFFFVISAQFDISEKTHSINAVFKIIHFSPLNSNGDLAQSFCCSALIISKGQFCRAHAKSNFFLFA